MNLTCQAFSPFLSWAGISKLQNPLLFLYLCFAISCFWLFQICLYQNQALCMLLLPPVHISIYIHIFSLFIHIICMPCTLVVYISNSVYSFHDIHVHIFFLYPIIYFLILTWRQLLLWYMFLRFPLYSLTCFHVWGSSFLSLIYHCIQEPIDLF